jgi:hypothetical protein
MSLPTAVRKTARPISRPSPHPDVSDELRFISDLGRSLLFTVHPKKVASRVASAIQNGIGAEVCAFVAELENIGVVSCAFDNKGELLGDFFAKQNSKSGSNSCPRRSGTAKRTVTSFC